MNVNLNTAQCLVHKSDFLSTTIYNVCTGTEKVVKHGAVDLVVGSLIGLLLFGVAAILFVFTIMIFRD